MCCRYEEGEVDTQILAILTPSGFAESSAEDGAGPLGLILGRTPFYAEQGGQVADTGELATSGALFTVQDTQVGT
jgi:alanyl-tRNA synthetase